jgi:hypothetical protein
MRTLIIVLVGFPAVLVSCKRSQSRELNVHHIDAQVQEFDMGREGAPQIPVKLATFNILGQGIAEGLPGPNGQATMLRDYLLSDESFLKKMQPPTTGISIVGFQEDVAVLKAGHRWDDRTSDFSHAEFEPLSFLDRLMTDETLRTGSPWLGKWTRVGLAVHDGNPKSGLLLKPGNDFLREILSPYHVGLADSKAQNVQKLCNTIYIWKGADAQDIQVEARISTFDTQARWFVDKYYPMYKRYGVLGSRSAIHAVVRRPGVGVLFVASNTHLSGGKFDDRWILTQDNLDERTNPAAMQLNYFAEQANELGRNAPVFLFGDCNMKHRAFMVDRPLYDDALMAMYFSGDKLSNPIQNDYYGYLNRIQQELATYEVEWVKLLQQNEGQVTPQMKAEQPRLMASLSPDAQTCVRLGIRARELNLHVYTDAPGTGPKHGAASTLFNRGKILWTLPAVAGMTAFVRDGVEDSSIMGGVIDQIFYRGASMVSYAISKDGQVMQKRSEPGLSEFTAFEAGTPFPQVAQTIFASGERIKASDHYPVMANFIVRAPETAVTLAGATPLQRTQSANLSQVRRVAPPPLQRSQSADPRAFPSAFRSGRKANP